MDIQTRQLAVQNRANIVTNDDDVYVRKSSDFGIPQCFFLAHFRGCRDRVIQVNSAFSMHTTPVSFTRFFLASICSVEESSAFFLRLHLCRDVLTAQHPDIKRDDLPANTRHWAIVGSMLGQRRRRWTSIGSRAVLVDLSICSINYGNISLTLCVAAQLNGWRNEWMNEWVNGSRSQSDYFFSSHPTCIYNPNEDLLAFIIFCILNSHRFYYIYILYVN